MQARTPNITGYSSLESEVKNLNTRKNLITPPGNRLRAKLRTINFGKKAMSENKDLIQIAQKAQNILE